MKSLFNLNLLGLLVSVGLAGGFLYAGLQANPKYVPEPAYQPALPRTHVTVLPATFDFGQVRQNQILNGEFELQNTFPVAFNVVLVRSSCSCTKQELTSKRIEPGQTVKLKVVWDTGTKRDESADRIVLVGNLEDEAKTTIRLVAKMKAVVQAE